MSSKNRPYSKSMVFRDLDFELPNIVFHERGASPMQLNRNNRKSMENGYIDRSPRPGVRSINDSPVNISHSNTSTPRLPRNTPAVYYAEMPATDKSSSSRPDRYKQQQNQQRCYPRREDLERYMDKREPPPHHQYTMAKSYQPSVYENFDNRQKHDSDTMYEIRKEKILLKSERSLSPLPTRIRSKSTERILDGGPKTVRYEDEYYSKSSADDSADSHKQQKPRTNYFVNNGSNSQVIVKDGERYRENVYIESSNSKRSNEPRVQYQQQQQHHHCGSRDEIYDNRSVDSQKNSSAIVNVVNNSAEIVYVPMVKEEFIKREHLKATSTGTSAHNFYT